MNPVELLAAMKRTVEQVAAFNDIAKALTSTLEVSQVLDVVGTRVSSLLGAERWSLLLGGDDGVLRFEVVHGVGAEKLRDEALVAGEGIAGAVFVSGKARLVADARGDPDFAPRFDLVTSHETGSVLAVPLKVRDRVLGVLELVNGKSLRPFTDDDLRAAATVADFAAIAIDNARNFEKVQELTITDEHTGLFNARHFLAQLSAERARCERFGRPMSLLFLDVDSFKVVNDTHGHLAGSKALELVGRKLTETLRAVDAAYRYGGDEFAVLLIETGPDGARAVGQRVVEAFRGAELDVGVGVPLRLTVSVGAASYPDDGTTDKAVLLAADRAMYRAKAKGRDRLECAS